MTQQALDLMGGLVSRLQESLRADALLERSRPAADRELIEELDKRPEEMNFPRVRHLILAKGANPSAPRYAHPNSQTLLMDALAGSGPFEAVMTMLDATPAADLGKVDAMGWNLAHFASFHSDQRIVDHFSNEPKFSALLVQKDHDGRLPQISPSRRIDSKA